ncbi:MAG: hemerythrin domain-containing protein [Bacteroidota bacterium]
MRIDQNMAMADVLLKYPGLIPFLSRFGIRLGFGNKTVNEICSENRVNTALFLEISNSCADPDYEPSENLGTIAISDLVSYIRNTHRVYTEKELPAVEKEISTLLNGSSLGTEQRKLLTDFFTDYKNEFIRHIRHEEEVVIPYILDLEKKASGEASDPERFRGFSILQYAREHDRLEKSLNDLAVLIIKYLPPFSDQDLCNKILTMMFSLEHDLIEHAKLEDRVLVPRVLELETRR